MTASTTIEPIRRSITVRRAPEEAFRIFTADFGAWWPFGGHSIGEEKVATAVMQAHTGGRVFERWHDGTEYDWATILVWDPPNRLVLDWNPNPERSTTTELEVRFVADGEATHVEVEHRGWERLGDIAERLRGNYAGGWPFVLQRFAQATTQRS